MNYIDLFSGCGGLSLGLHKAGLKGLFAVEKNRDAFCTLKFNLIDRLHHFDWPNWLRVQNHNIDTLLENKRDDLASLKGTVDLIAGGPPCQGFSLAGRRQSDDKRNHMVTSYIDVVKLVRPRFIFLENVKGITIPFHTDTTPVSFRDNLVTDLDNIGYDVAYKLVNFSNYGVPQKRIRFILAGFLKSDPRNKGMSANTFFELLDRRKTMFLENNGLPISGTAHDAISDLLMAHGAEQHKESKRFYYGKYGAAQTPYQRLMRSTINETQEMPDSHRFAQHSKIVTQRFKAAIESKMSPSAYRKHFNLKKSSTKLLSDSAPSPTLTTLPDDYIHYSEPRILTVREYARIQTFPDDYTFLGKYTTGGKRRVKEVPRYTQVGNAIPPLFGELAGLVLKELANE